MKPRKSRARDDYEGPRPKLRGAPWRWYKDGKLRETALPLLRELFLEDVLIDGETDCWLWKGRLSYQGYGQTYLLGATHPAHRVAYVLFKGELPEKAHACHKCDNPPCVNPEHLWLGNHRDNMQDKLKKGRQRGRHNTGNDPFTHCPQGHEYSQENTYMYQGRRYCRACHKQYTLNYSRKEKDKAPRTHCQKGHEFTPENTYMHRGVQQCRACHRECTRNWARRHRAKRQSQETP